ncbi:MAG TPA: DUF1573 domain-containing protein [Thermoanaerobaculia bacterium]|nr:DUF1573 domain-containing protein [Thermoanaerobaculia bacterium]
MSDDFGTINVRRGERAREIEVMRQHYRSHRDALQRMHADAPTEHLASEYQRLIGEIDRNMVKLDELEGGDTMPLPPPPAIPPPPFRGSAPKTEAGTQPLIVPENHDLPETEAEPRSRLPLILGAAVIALAAMAGLAWWASSDRKPVTGIVEDGPVAGDTADTTDTTATETATTAGATATVDEGLAAAPPSHDYGTIRKGTRATRQFELTNNTDQPVTIVVARSACRCLFYEHARIIPPKAKENLTVTIDAARAKAGELREAVKITAKSDPSVGTTVDVIATVQ